MRLLFLDESGRSGQDGLFALGGLTVREEEWRALRACWLAPLEEHGWDPTNEVKWHGIRTGQVPPALADAVIDALARAPFTAYVTLLDLERGADLADFFGTPEQTYGTALMFVSERFHHLLEAGSWRGSSSAPRTSRLDFSAPI